jgi:acetyltransferase-like isoleucine patch superfamily enzyme
MIHPSTPAVLASATAADLARAGLLEAGPGCQVSPHAVFLPADMLGTLRPVVLGARCTIGAGAVLHGGTQLAAGVRVEEHVVVGCPEHGYAVRNVYPGAGEPTVVGEDVVLRSGATVYAGVTIGAATMVGHHALLRSHAAVGTGSQLGHNLTVERECRIGSGVRMSPGTHLTAATEVADSAFLGAGVRTVNDKHLIWRDPEHQAELTPPRFCEGCKVGSGSTILAGITIGEHCLVGAGSVVTRDIPPHATAYGVPARIHAPGRAR